MRKNSALSKLWKCYCYCLLKSSQRTGIDWHECGSSPGGICSLELFISHRVASRYDMHSTRLGSSRKGVVKVFASKEVRTLLGAIRRRISQTICYLQLVVHSRFRLWLRGFLVSSWKWMCETVVICCRSLIMNI